MTFLNDHPLLKGLGILGFMFVVLLTVRGVSAGYDIPPGFDMPFSIKEVITCPEETPLGNLEPFDEVDRTIEVHNSSHNDQIVKVSTDDDDKYEGLSTRIDPPDKAIIPANSTALFEIFVEVKGDAETVEDGNLHWNCERFHED